MTNTISCIVPFYNEVPRIYQTLQILSQSKYINEIITIDDGSTDNPQIHTPNYNGKVIIMKHDTNKGKSEALRTGLQKASGNLILLVDADFKELKGNEIDNAIKKFLEHPEADMLILRSTKGTWITRACRQDIVLSGFRMLKRHDLEEVYKTNPHGYQIETAINAYMVEHGKKSYYTEFSGYNTLRNEKIGLLAGFIGLVLLLKDVYTYQGYLSYIRQLWTFCYEEL